MGEAVASKVQFGDILGIMNHSTQLLLYDILLLLLVKVLKIYSVKKSVKSILLILIRK